MSGFTKGPWFADKNGAIWRRNPSELYENGGGVAGDKPIASCNKGWFGDSEQGYPFEKNAELIAMAPTLYAFAEKVARTSNDQQLVQAALECLALCEVRNEQAL